MSDSEKFEAWAVVEIFGHQSYAGKVTEQTIGGASFVRLDVPGIPGESGRPGFTKLFGASSIYAITPCTEEVARAAAAEFRKQPLSLVSLPSATRTLPPFLEVDDDDRDEE